MNLLGINFTELILLFVIILLVLGPKEMVDVGAKLGGFIRNIITSDAWKAMKDTSREFRNMPNKLAREAGLEEFRKQIQEQEEFRTIGNPLEDIPEIDSSLDAWTTGPKTSSEEKDEGENTNKSTNEEMNKE